MSYIGFIDADAAAANNADGESSYFSCFCRLTTFNGVADGPIRQFCGAGVLIELINVGTHDIDDETNDIDGTLLFENLVSLFSVKRISGENRFSNLNGFAVTKNIENSMVEKKVRNFKNKKKKSASKSFFFLKLTNFKNFLG